MSDSAQQAMQTLTNQWYNAVVTGLGLDPNTFQLIQASEPLGTTSQSLWQFFDSLPPKSATQYFNPTQFSSYQETYGAVVNSLVIPNDPEFQVAMGDYYAQWQTYLNGVTTIPAGGVLQLLKTWTQLHMPPSTAAQAVTAYLQDGNNPVTVATNMYDAVLNSTSPVFAYSGSYASLQNQLSSAEGKSVAMNSSTESSDVSHTWAQGSAQAEWDIFSGETSVSYDRLTTQFASAEVNVSASFARVLQFAASPLEQPSTDPTLSQYTPWYYSPALNLAYKTQDNTVWKPGSTTTWATTFGPTGVLQQVCGALVVVDGVNVTITSAATFSSSDQTTFQQATSGGFWPFFSAGGSSGWSSSASFDTSGAVTVTITSPAGNPQILGCIVTPIAGVAGE
jgi:hypothetical protein